MVGCKGFQVEPNVRPLFFEGQASKTRPFPIKTMVIKVPGIKIPLSKGIKKKKHPKKKKRLTSRPLKNGWCLEDEDFFYTFLLGSRIRRLFETSAPSMIGALAVAVSRRRRLVTSLPATLQPWKA